MRNKLIIICLVFTSCLLGSLSLAHASEGKSSIKFYLENIAPEGEETILDNENSTPEKYPKPEIDTGVSQNKLPQTSFKHSKIMMIIGNLLLVFVLLIIRGRKEKEKNEKA